MTYMNADLQPSSFCLMYGSTMLDPALRVQCASCLILMYFKEGSRKVLQKTGITSDGLLGYEIEDIEASLRGAFSFSSSLLALLN